MKAEIRQTEEDIFVPEFSDEALEAIASVPNGFPTFTCGMPMCGTGGSCGTFLGGNCISSSEIQSEGDFS
jgi:hypothetical protein